MNGLPITLCFFTSTKGHHGRKRDYAITLDHWDKQVPLSLFNLVAHVKTSVGDEALGCDICLDLKRRGFHVIETVGSWTRGLSHGASYLADQIKVSKDSRVYDRPYLLFLEDDSPAIHHNGSAADTLARMCQQLERNHEQLTSRLVRRASDRFPVAGEEVTSAGYWSIHIDLQPMIMRSIDFYRTCIALESRPDLCQSMQCEALFKAAMDSFSRSPRKHWVVDPDVAETIHIGVEQSLHEQALTLL